MRFLLIISLGVLSIVFAEDSKYPWLRLPPTPTLPEPRRGQYAQIDGLQIWYQVYGSKHAPPLLFFHAGFGNSDYWGIQVRALRSKYRCIVMDSRGHGRSTLSTANINYNLMASDAIALLNLLHINKTHIIGWNDGAIVALNIAMKYPNRVRSLFVFAANYVPSGVKDLIKSPVFMTYLNRSKTEYETLNPEKNYTNFSNKLFDMWYSLPMWNKTNFERIKTDLPVWIVDGDHEEAIYREQADTMAEWIPQAGELILPRTSHFAFLQNPALFTWSIRRFLIEARNSY